tara:strand:+ start:3646 stop:7245 length:3600 start_codon:yes stop_codon:yes gene_type:complete
MLRDNILDELDKLDAEEDEEAAQTLQITDEDESDELDKLDAMDLAEDEAVQGPYSPEESKSVEQELDDIDALDGAVVQATEKAPVVEEQQEAETPLEQYARTGEVPEGFKVVPQVPTGDTPEDYLPKLEPIDAPTPTVSEQTEAAFNYDKTRELAKLFDDNPDLDILGVDEFVEKSVPKPLQGVVRFLGKATNEDLESLAVAVQSVEDTAVNLGTALTMGLEKIGVDMGFGDDRKAGEKFAGDLGMLLEMMEATVPGAGAIFSPVRRTFKEAKKIAKAKAKGEIARKKLLERKMNINRAKEATAEDIAKKADDAAVVANQNDDLRQAFIEDFERTTGKTISDEVDGKKVLNADKAREAGRETAQKLDAGDTRTRVQKALGSDVELDDAALLAGQADKITMPVLKSDKLNGLVAAAAELKDRVPKAFAPKKYESGKDYTVIDHLFDLTVEKELIPGDELIDVLNKYNVSFEDYILTVVGSGSEAGKTLQKLSQIKRVRPLNEMQELQRAATQAQQNVIRNGIMRIEGIRRGGLVSQLATAARNLESAAIRSPMDTLANIMDTALYNAGRAEGLAGKTKAFTSAATPFTKLGRTNYVDSFKHMRYMFGPESRLDTKDYVDFILDRPELAKQYDLMFNQLNELQAATGRGLATTRAGKVVDGVLSELEDGVSVLNSANRFQEYLVRRGQFLGELERLVKREYNIDLIDTLNDGKIRDLLNDATSVRPKGARSFNELVADATTKALDVTYAKQPETKLFREVTNFITRNGLTVAIPFPRFMFNALELMGNYAGGASIPLTKKMMNVVSRGALFKEMKGPLSAADRRRISRNIVGMAGVLAAYQARSTDDAPADYKELSMGDGTVMDTTPQFPLRQFLYLGEVTRRLNEEGPGWIKTVDDWFDPKEFMETFLGTNIRVGVGNSIIEEVINLAGGSDLTKSEQAARAAGRALGNYLSTWAVPAAQIIDSQRALGMRGEEYKDVSTDPTLDAGKSFKENLMQPLRARGFTISPEEEAAAPTRQRLFQEKPSRVGSAIKVGLGLSLKTQDNQYGEYIKNLGLSEFELGSSSKVPSIRRFENEQLREIIPGLVDAAQAYEQQSREEYRENETLQEEMTEQEFVNSRIRPLIKEQIKSAKKLLTDGKTIAADAPVYVEAMMAYRRLPPEIRKSAATEFIVEFDRPADGANLEDLIALAEIGKVIKATYR